MTILHKAAQFVQIAKALQHVVRIVLDERGIRSVEILRCPQVSKKVSRSRAERVVARLRPGTQVVDGNAQRSVRGSVRFDSGARAGGQRNAVCDLEWSRAELPGPAN